MSVTLAVGRLKEILMWFEDQQSFSTGSTAYHFYQNSYIRLTYHSFNGQWFFGPTDGEELITNNSANMRHEKRPSQSDKRSIRNSEAHRRDKK